MVLCDKYLRNHDMSSSKMFDLLAVPLSILDMNIPGLDLVGIEISLLDIAETFLGPESGGSFYLLLKSLLLCDVYLIFNSLASSVC